MSAPRLTLAQQLKLLEQDDERPVVERDVEADEELQGYVVEGAAEYDPVPDSKLRDKTSGLLSQLDAKYNAGGVDAKKGKRRVKVFDDDLSEDDEEMVVRGEDGWMGGSDAGGSASGSEESEDESGSEDEDEDEDEEDEDEEGKEEDAAPPPTRKPSAPSKTLDPLASLQASKSKEVLKGRAILRQQKLFDDLLTVRITFQKAWTASARVPSTKRKASSMESDPETEDAADLTTSTLAPKRTACLESLASLSEELFQLRDRVAACLPGYIAAEGTTKRRRTMAHEGGDTSYWKSSADDSITMLDSAHDTLLTTLTKWSTKIQAASIQQAMLAGKAAGSGNKFSAGAGQTGVVEAIDGSLNSKALSGANMQDEHAAEEAFYKSLLREVIEARAAGTGGASGIDVGQLRSEKKKKRDAERGASKGRKIRYTVHEKAQNFTVPIPLTTSWATEQIDELFTSLLGGAGLAGAGAERDDQGVMGAIEAEEDAGLGGLRVF